MMRSLAWIGLSVAISAGACQQADRSIGNKATAGEVKCDGVTSPVRREADSVPAERACAFVRQAIRVLAAATSGGGVPEAADTALISSAVVDAIAETDSLGSTKAAWWLVTLHLDRKPYDGEVRFPQPSGAPVIRPIHK